MAIMQNQITECPNCRKKLKKGQCKKCGYVKPINIKSNKFHNERY